MQLSELVALLSLAAVDDASKEDNLGNVLVKAGFALSATNNPPSLLEVLRARQTVSVSETARILRALRLDFSSREDLNRERQVHYATKALANGALCIPSATLILFLCFVVALPTANKLEFAIAGLRRDDWSVRHELRRDEVLDAIPHLIAVSYAASVLMDSPWSPTSQGFGSMSFSSTQALLRGVAETTYDSFVGPESRLAASNFYTFLEICAKNLSDLMLQQTLLEQEATRINVTAEGRSSVHLIIMQSRQLLEKYGINAVDLERVLNEVWRSSVVVSASLEETPSRQELASASETTSIPGSTYNAPTDCDVPNAAVSCIVQNGTNDAQTAPSDAAPSSIILQQENENQNSQQQNDIFQGLAQIAGDFGQRLVMVTLGRFLLFLALLYGTAALAFILVHHAGFSVALSLAAVFGFTSILALIALYCAGKGCRQFGDEASRNVCSLLQANPTTVAVNELLRDNGTQGLQPVVKTVVSTLVPEQSHCSMIPVRRPMMQLHDSDDDGTPTRRRRQRLPVEIKPEQRLNSVQQESASHSGEDESVAARLRGIVSTVGKIAAHFNNESQQNGEGHGRQLSMNGRRISSYDSSNVESSGLELQRQTTNDKLLNAYPHMRDGS